MRLLITTIVLERVLKPSVKRSPTTDGRKLGLDAPHGTVCVAGSSDEQGRIRPARTATGAEATGRGKRCSFI